MEGKAGQPVGTMLPTGYLGLDPEKVRNLTFGPSPSRHTWMLLDQMLRVRQRPGEIPSPLPLNVFLRVWVAPAQHS